MRASCPAHLTALDLTQQLLLDILFVAVITAVIKILRGLNVLKLVLSVKHREIWIYDLVK